MDILFEANQQPDIKKKTFLRASLKWNDGMQALSSSIGGDIILFLPPGIQLLVISGRYIITLGNLGQPFYFYILL